MNDIKLTLNIRDGLFTLNEGTLEALRRPRQVQLLINVEQKMLVLRACGTEAAQAVVIPEENVISTDISGRSLLKKISTQMEWEDEFTRECTGRFLPKYQAVCFDLSTVHYAQ